MGSPDVTVIGAGAVGVAVALEAARRGASVTILERGASVAAGCSAGNAGIVGSAHVLPLAEPAAVLEGMRMLTRRNGALALNPRPRTLSWLARFLWAARPSRYRAGAEALARLAGESAELHRSLGERCDTGFAQRGFLSVLADEKALAAARAHAGATSTVLDGRAVRQLCPQLAIEPAGAVLDEAGAQCDPERFVTALAQAAGELGVRLRTGVDVLEIRRRGTRAASLWTTAGELPAGEVVLAAGAWSPALAAGLPITVPIQGGKGYHLEYDRVEGDVSLPLYFPQHRVVVTPLQDRLRVSGTMQFSGTDLRVHGGRVDVVAGHARTLLAGVVDRPVRRVWRGLRPCTPDGLPLIGRVPGVENVTLATGHGMWGLQLAPVTGRLVADLLAGEPDTARLRPMAPERFSFGAARAARRRA